MTYRLDYGAESGALCAKCSQLFRDGQGRSQKPALYTLAQGAMKWPLCGNHAAASAHNLQIPHPTFTPHLQVQNTEKTA